MRRLPVLPGEEGELAEGVGVVPGVEEGGSADVDRLVCTAPVQDGEAHGVVLSLAPHHVHRYLLSIQQKGPSVHTFPPAVSL